MESIRTLYPKRLRNKEIDESIRLAMIQFKEQKAKIMADKVAQQTNQAN